MQTGKYSRSQAAAIAYTEARHSKDEEEDHERDLVPEPASDIVAFIVYTDGDKILWLQRSKDDTWGFPGGHVEEGESPIEGAIRESREEVLHVPETGLHQIYKKGNVHLFGCDDGEFVPDLNEEHTDYVWATIEDAPEPLFHRISKRSEKIAEAAEAHAAAMDKREYDTNNWFEVARNPLSKVGVYPYLGRSISPDLIPDRLYQVYRPAEELGSEEAMRSLRLIPWVDEHVMLGSEESGLLPAERKGVQGMTGEQTEFDGETLFCNIKVISEAMKSLIDSGKEELSLGYTCEYEATSGTFKGQNYDFIQRNLRFNHLALVERGRMGAEVRVLDHAEEPKMAKVSAEKLRAFKAQILAAFDALDEDESKPDCETKLGEDDKEEESKETKKESEDDAESEKKEEKKDKKESGMDEAVIVRNVEKALAEKNTLYQKLSNVVGSFDHADMSIDKMVKYGCEKLKIDVPKSERKSALHGYLMANTVKPAAMDSVQSAGSCVDAYLKGK